MSLRSRNKRRDFIAGSAKDHIIESSRIKEKRKPRQNLGPWTHNRVRVLTTIRYRRNHNADPFFVSEGMSLAELDRRIYNLLSNLEFKKKDPYRTNKSLDMGIRMLRWKILKEKPISYF